MSELIALAAAVALVAPGIACEFIFTGHFGDFYVFRFFHCHSTVGI